MTVLEQLADAMARKAAGAWDALDGWWAPETIVWHCYDERESRRRTDVQAESSAAKHDNFQRRVADFHRDATYHLSETTQTIVEVAVWSGAGPEGEALRLHTCIVYTIEDGLIARMAIYDDQAASRRWAAMIPPALSEAELERRSGTAEVDG